MVILHTNALSMNERAQLKELYTTSSILVSSTLPVIISTCAGSVAQALQSNLQSRSRGLPFPGPMKIGSTRGLGSILFVVAQMSAMDISEEPAGAGIAPSETAPVIVSTTQANSGLSISV